MFLATEMERAKKFTIVTWLTFVLSISRVWKNATTSKRPQKSRPRSRYCEIFEGHERGRTTLTGTFFIANMRIYFDVSTDTQRERWIWPRTWPSRSFERQNHIFKIVTFSISEIKNCGVLLKKMTLNVIRRTQTTSSNVIQLEAFRTRWNGIWLVL